MNEKEIIEKLKNTIKFSKRTDNEGNPLPRHCEFIAVNTAHPYCYREPLGNGKTKYKYFYTYLDLLVFVAENAAKITRGKDVKKSGFMTLKDLFSEFMKDKSNLEESSLESYRQNYKNHIEDDEIGNTPIRDITHRDLQKYVNRKLETLSVGTVTKITTIIAQCLQIAVNDELITSNPALKLKYEKKKVKVDDVDLRDYQGEEDGLIALSEEQCAKLYEWLDENKIYGYYRPMIQFSQITGLRVSELCGLMWDGIKDDGILINHQLNYIKDNNDNHYKLKNNFPKRRKIRTVHALDDERIQQILKEVKERQFRGKACKSEIDGYSRYIFTKKCGSAFTKETINQMLNRLINAYNKKNPNEPLPHISSHVFRRTAITQWLENGVDVAAAAKEVGHSGTNTIMKHYFKPHDDYLKREMQKVSHAYKIKEG